ncbi:uncharacterized protein DS421_13g390210 [Arachis hypogaea]|nr:uncharacterized protein DS421_13g390210 [Arachis hypogaea]
MVVLHHLRQSPWLNDLHCHHPHPQCRHHVDRLFRHIDEVQHYIRRYRLLPTVVTHSRRRPLNQCNHHREQFMELRRVHQNQLRESLTRIRRSNINHRHKKKDGDATQIYVVGGVDPAGDKMMRTIEGRRELLNECEVLGVASAVVFGDEDVDGMSPYVWKKGKRS